MSQLPFYQIVIYKIAIALLIYVFYELWNMKGVKEGMSSGEPFYKEVSQEIAYKKMDGNEFPSGISDMPKKSQDMELMQYCIKGSANSALSGEYISDEMVKYVLSRGCRFLDFEVYYLPIGNSQEEADVFAPYVGYSSDPASISSTSKNNYLFRKIFKTTLANAFTRQSGDKYESPNPKDPLFIHIRIKTNESNKNTLYDMIQKDIHSVYSSGYNEYFLIQKNKETEQNESIQVEGTTPIKKLAQKVIVVFDYEPETYIGTYHNLTSDSAELKRMTYEEMNTFRYRAMPPKRLDSKKTDVSAFMMAVPDSNRSTQSNPNIHSAIKNYGVQVTLMQYYNTDMNLIRGESMFQQYGAAILPMSLLLNYIKTNGTEDSTTIFPQLFEVKE